MLLLPAFKSMGWHLRPDGSWTHQAVPRQRISWVRNLQIDRIKRLLREAWRFERFAAWQASGRLDAVAAANTTFQNSSNQEGLATVELAVPYLPLQ